MLPIRQVNSAKQCIEKSEKLTFFYRNTFSFFIVKDLTLFSLTDHLYHFSLFQIRQVGDVGEHENLY